MTSEENDAIMTSEENDAIMKDAYVYRESEIGPGIGC